MYVVNLECIKCEKLYKLRSLLWPSIAHVNGNYMYVRVGVSNTAIKRPGCPDHVRKRPLRRVGFAGRIIRARTLELDTSLLIRNHTIYESTSTGGLCEDSLRGVRLLTSATLCDVHIASEQRSARPKVSNESLIERISHISPLT